MSAEKIPGWERRDGALIPLRRPVGFARASYERDFDEWRGLQAEAREEERDWAQWEAEREEPATKDGGWE